jgi:hypothetical protein
MRWQGRVARTGKLRNAYKILIGKPEGKRPPGGPKCKWDNNIRMDLMEVGWEFVDWIHLAQERDQLGITGIHFSVPLMSNFCIY